MIGAFLTGLALTASASAEVQPFLPQDITVPSGQPVSFLETQITPPGLTARFRFVAPELRDTVERLSFADLEADLAYLCETYALPRLGVPEPAHIVISLAEVPVELGTPAPDIVQIFESYRPVDEACEWEAF
ncbi:DUF6497 family protein [Celeribacter arenosi]|uniref:DUF6497 family protein n=1 Tax=Celeribacter arenosi TaxID=792649 RepID=A0ABP7JSF9_9RHOB